MTLRRAVWPLLAISVLLPGAFLSTSAAGDSKRQLDCGNVLFRAKKLDPGILEGYYGLRKEDALRVARKHGFNIIDSIGISMPEERPPKEVRLCMNGNTSPYPRTAVFDRCLKSKGNPELRLIDVLEASGTAVLAGKSDTTINVDKIRRHLNLLKIAEVRFAEEIVLCS